MIFIKNPDVKNMIGIYSNNKKWQMVVINTGKYEWTPTKFTMKNDDFVNEKYIIPMSKVPKKLLYNLIKFSFQPEKIDRFKKILE